MKGERSFVVYVLMPAFFFLVMFYVYPTLFNLVKQHGMGSTRIIVGYGGSRNIAELGNAPKVR